MSSLRKRSGDFFLPCFFHDIQTKRTLSRICCFCMFPCIAKNRGRSSILIYSFIEESIEQQNVQTCIYREGVSLGSITHCSHKKLATRKFSRSTCHVSLCSTCMH